MKTNVHTAEVRADMGFSQPLPPGTILQCMYLKDRLRLLKPGRFVEIGCGQGFITEILLQAGWSGVAYDLNDDSLKIAHRRNAQAVASKKLVFKNLDWLQEINDDKVDLVISSLVLEHMDDKAEALYVQKCKTSLACGGKAVLFVPNSPAHWGIEDEIAGHYRRYTADSISQLFGAFGLNCIHTAALTYPISNWLLPIGNRLVKKAEEAKLAQSMTSRTVQSSNRKVAFKTSFPNVLGLILNETTMRPFHELQKANIHRDDALILYAEFGLPVKVESTSAHDRFATSTS